MTEVEIVEIDNTIPITFSTNRFLNGYCGIFKCNNLQGKALFVPASNKKNGFKVGDKIMVETSQNTINNLKVLEEETPSKIIFHSNSGYGCYQVIAIVVFNIDNEIFEIESEYFSFQIDVNDTCGKILKEGQCVSLVIEDLILWDSGE